MAERKPEEKVDQPDEQEQVVEEMKLQWLRRPWIVSQTKKVKPMAQKKDRPIDEILKLVDQLSPEEQDELDEQLKLRWLRRAVDQADESMAQGKVVSQEELDRRLDAVHAEILERQKK